MGVIVKQSILSSAISYVGIGVAYLSLIVVQPQFLSTDEMGLIRLFVQSSLLLSLIFQFGAPYIITKYFPELNKDSYDNGLLSLVLIIATIGFVICAILLTIFREQLLQYYSSDSALVSEYYYFIIPLIGFVIYNGVFEMYSTSQLKIVFPNFIKEIFIRIFQIVIIVLYHFSFIHFDGLIYLFVLSYFTSLLLNLINISRNGNVIKKINHPILSSFKIKEIVKYGLYIMLGSVGGAFIATIDFLMVGSMVGLSSIAIYSTGFYIATIIEIPKRALTQIINPIISQSINNDDFENVEKLYKKSSINQLTIGMLLFLGIWMNIDSLFLLIPKSEIFSQAKYVILFISLGKIFDLATGVNAQIIANSKHYKFLLYSILFMSLMTVVFNYYLIPFWGINGASIATMLTLFIFNLIMFLFVWLKFKVQPFSIQTLKVLFISLLVFLIFNFLKLNFPPFISILIKSILIFISYSTLILFLNISEDITLIYLRIRTVMINKLK